MNALARRVEYIDGGEGEPEIPTGEALAGWLPMAPEAARVEAGELLKQLPWPRMLLDGILVKDGDQASARWEPWDGRSWSLVGKKLVRHDTKGRKVLVGVAVFKSKLTLDEDLVLGEVIEEDLGRSLRSARVPERRAST